MPAIGAICRLSLSLPLFLSREDNNVESIFLIGEPSFLRCSARLPTSVLFSSPQHPFRGMQTATHGGDIYPTIPARAINCDREDRRTITDHDACRCLAFPYRRYINLSSASHYRASLRDLSTEIATTSPP